MTVNFKFDYVLNLHDKNTYINHIEQYGIEDEIAYERSLLHINKRDIKEITKSPDGSATITFKHNETVVTTLEEYDDIYEVIQKADIALDIMYQEKVYIFDEFEVDEDELNVCESWSAMRDELCEVERKQMMD